MIGKNEQFRPIALSDIRHVNTTPSFTADNKCCYNCTKQEAFLHRVN